MNTEQPAKCVEDVTDDGWHFWRCNRPAKWIVAYSGRDEHRPVCGIHVKWYRNHGTVVTSTREEAPGTEAGGNLQGLA